MCLGLHKLRSDPIRSQKVHSIENRNKVQRQIISFGDVIQ